MWRHAIPRKDRLLQATDHVCERHFEPHLVSKTWTAEYKGHVLMSVPRRAELAKDAVPTKFPDCPAYLSKSTKSRKRPADRQPLQPVPPAKKKNVAFAMNEVREQPNALPSSDHGGGGSSPLLAAQTDESADFAGEREQYGSALSAKAVSSPFETLFNGPLDSCLPSKTWGFHRIEVGQAKSVVFSQLKCVKITGEGPSNSPHVEQPGTTASCSSGAANFASSLVAPRIVEVDASMNVRTVLLGKAVFIEKRQHLGPMSTFEDVGDLLMYVEKLRICAGGPSTLEYPDVDPKSAFVDMYCKWRHNSCQVMLDTDSSVCRKCASLSDTLRIHQRRKLEKKRKVKARGLRTFPLRQNRDKIAALRRANYALKRSKSRLLKRFKSLSAELKQARQRIQTLSEEELDIKLGQMHLPSAQLTAVKECISAARFQNKKNRRYTEDWLLMCLLLHIRSPAAYSFLRDNDVLPLPCVTTVRRYLSLVRTKCGFDTRFFAALKKKLAMKNEFQRRGILVFDEMQVRKEMRVHSKTMTYSGYSDFGDTASSTSNDLADHGLVFTFRSFGDSYSQPIGVFASKGPTKGKTLAQLVLKAIFLLEEAGAFVDALVCDGATTNRCMWREFGISGSLQHTKHSFIHPVDDARSVYVFSDAPHLMKCVRNRLHAQKVLCFDGERAQWAHYDKLFVEDLKQPAHLRVCPKITFAHINPTNTEKMRVKLATQIFSRSVADGLEFYSVRVKDGLQNVKGTVQFTKKFNDLFDALNRNHPKEGIASGSKDLRVLASFLHWLNKWEKEVASGKVARTSFLTEQTAEGLRVTVLSALELSRYLLKSCGFKYVLTGKFNQDVLERFFGIIRHVGGQNEHPSMPTFLQLYNMLSVYSLMKPPKFGNCEVQGSQERCALTLTDLKLAFQEAGAEKTKLQELKQKLDGLVSAEVECDDVFDHVYEVPGTSDCIIYYLAGFMCRKLLRNTVCLICRESLVEESEVHKQPEGALVLCKTRGGLLHPKRNIFHFLQSAEAQFHKHEADRNVYELTVESVLEEQKFSFPCPSHKEEIMATLLHGYVAMRMRQFCKQRLLQMKNKAQQLRKLAKLT